MPPLDKRAPGQTLAAIIPPAAEPSPVNLFGAKLGDTFDRRFDPARLSRRGPRPVDVAAQKREATS
ncbi:hypothetical protein [Streptomyces sp. NPDC056463]|uniref:hypothetical protein n=1 Tax=Streptomyces sp. NPDC056463 TaxID=3345827 RepID=UPI0036C8F3D6